MQKRQLRQGITVILIISFFIGLATLYNKLKAMDRIDGFDSPLGKSFSIFSAITGYSGRPKYTVYGYLPYWNLDKVSDLRINYLTDIAYFGMYINPDGTIMERLDDGTAEPGYQNWQSNEALDAVIRQSKKSGVDVALTIMSHIDSNSDRFLNCPFCWRTLAAELETQMAYKQIDSVNVNFEYVEYTDAETADKYTKFVEFLSSEIHKKHPFGKVVVATFADSAIKPRVTKPADLARVCDGLFIMAYDFHRPDSDLAGPVAPIDGIGVVSNYDIRTMLKDYLAVVSPGKLIMGVPYYGYNWVVSDTAPGSPRVPGDDTVGYSQSQAYSDIMEIVERGGKIDTNVAGASTTEKDGGSGGSSGDNSTGNATGASANSASTADSKVLALLTGKTNPVPLQVQWDTVGQVPFITYTSPETGSTRQAYFENEQSLEVKYKLIRENRLAGVGIWALGYDHGRKELWGVLGRGFR